MPGRSPERAYKVAVYLPPDYLDAVMDAVTEAIEPLYPGYDRVFSWHPVRSTWRPLPGSNPYQGEVGRIETADEVKLEFAVREEFLEAAVSAIVRTHPFEEPAIDVIPIIPWKDVTAPSGGR